MAGEREDPVRVPCLPHPQQEVDSAHLPLLWGLWDSESTGGFWKPLPETSLGGQDVHVLASMCMCVCACV